MQRTRASGDPAARGLERIVLEDPLALVVALGRPGLPLADVDRRVEDHAGTGEPPRAAKFESSRRPAELDFSGWNWTP